MKKYLNMFFNVVWKFCEWVVTKNFSTFSYFDTSAAHGVLRRSRLVLPLLLYSEMTHLALYASVTCPMFI